MSSSFVHEDSQSQPLNSVGPTNSNSEVVSTSVIASPLNTPQPRKMGGSSSAIPIPTPSSPNQTTTSPPAVVPQPSATQRPETPQLVLHSLLEPAAIAEVFAWTPKELGDPSALFSLQMRMRMLFDTLQVLSTDNMPGSPLVGQGVSAAGHSTIVDVVRHKVLYMSYVINLTLEHTVLPEIKNMKNDNDVRLVEAFHVSWDLFYGAVMASRGALDGASVRVHAHRLEETAAEVSHAVMAGSKRRAGIRSRASRQLLVHRGADWVTHNLDTIVLTALICMLLAVVFSALAVADSVTVSMLLALALGLVATGLTGLSRWGVMRLEAHQDLPEKIVKTLSSQLNEFVGMTLSGPMCPPQVSSTVKSSMKKRNSTASVASVVGANDAHPFLAAGASDVFSDSQFDMNQQQQQQQQQQAPSATKRSKRRVTLWTTEPAGNLLLPLGDQRGTVVRCPASVLHDKLIIIVVDQQHTITIWNEAAIEATGFTQFDALGKNFLGLLADDNTVQGYRTMTQTAREDEDGGEEELILYHAQLGVMPVRVTVRQALSMNDEDLGFIIMGSYNNAAVDGRGNRMRTWVHRMMQYHYTKVFQSVDIDAMPNEEESADIQALGRFITLSAPDVLNANSEAAMYNSTAQLTKLLGEVMNDDVVEEAKVADRVMVTTEIDANLPTHLKIDVAKVTRVLIDLVLFAIRACPTSGTVTIYAQANTTHAKSSTIDFLVDRPGKGVSPSALSLMRSIGAASVVCYTGDKTKDEDPDSSLSEYIQGLCKLNNIVRTMAGVFSCKASAHDLRLVVTLPYSTPEDRNNSELSNHSTLVEGQINVRLTLLLVEESNIYRFSFSQIAWDDGHAVYLANTLDDVDSIMRNPAPPEMVFIDSIVPGARSVVNAIAKAHPDTLIIWTRERDSLAGIDKSGGVGNDANQQEESEDDTTPSQCAATMMKPFTARDFRALVEQLKARLTSKEATKQQIAKVREIFTEHHGAPWSRGECIGQGRFGKVYSATNTLTGGKMAVKTIQLDLSDPRAEETTMELINEIDMMRTLEHENILHYFYCERTNSAINIFMEFAEGGSLAKLIESDGPIGLQQAAIYTWQLLKAVSYIHKLKIVHRDIKGGNLLLSRGSLKLGDFGSARKREGDEVLTQTVGTVRWMAPEVARGDPYDYRCDIWSIGCTVIEMMTGKAPFANVHGTSVQIMDHIASLEGTSDGGATLMGAIGSFVSQCLQVDPAHRPSADTLLTHPFITDTEMEEHRMAAYTCKDPLMKRKSVAFAPMGAQGRRKTRKDSAYQVAGESMVQLQMLHSNNDVVPGAMRRRSRRISAWDDDDDDSEIGSGGGGGGGGGSRASIFSSQPNLGAGGSAVSHRSTPSVKHQRSRGDSVWSVYSASLAVPHTSNAPGADHATSNSTGSPSPVTPPTQMMSPNGPPLAAAVAHVNPSYQAEV
eukprot:PhM_4_TR15241/c0_g1_i1/m.59399